MKALNRKSELYQFLFQDAMRRLVRVPAEFHVLRTSPDITLGSDVMGYVLEKSELEFEFKRPGATDDKPLVVAGEFFSKRLPQMQAMIYGQEDTMTVNVPVKLNWAFTVLSAFCTRVYSRNVNSVIPFELERAAHNAVMEHADRLVKSYARNAIIANDTREFVPVFAGMAHQFDRCEKPVALLNKLSVSEYGELILRCAADRTNLFVTFYPEKGSPNRTFKRGPVQLSEVYSHLTMHNMLLDLAQQALLLEAVPSVEQAEAIIANAVPVFGSVEEVWKRLRVAMYRYWMDQDVIDPADLYKFVASYWRPMKEYMVAVYVVNRNATTTFDFSKLAK